MSITLATVAEVEARRAARAARDAREIAIINRNIDTLNAEARDVLDYQLAKEQF